MTPAIDQLRDQLATLRRTGASLDAYARLRLELDDYERAERVAAVVKPAPAMFGGGLHLLK